MGILSLFPPEILHQILQYLTYKNVIFSASVSKYWFQQTTAKDFWANHRRASVADPDPFVSIQRSIISARIWTPYKDHYIYATDKDVINGENMLVWEEGYLQGLKLNGQVK